MFAFDHIDVPQHGETEKSLQRHVLAFTKKKSEQAI